MVSNLCKKRPFSRYPTLLCGSKWIIYCNSSDQTFFQLFHLRISSSLFHFFCFFPTLHVNFVLLPGKNAVEFKSLSRSLIHTDFQNLQKVKQIVLKVWKCLKIRPCLYVAQQSNLIQTDSIPKPPAVPNIFFVIFLTWTLTQARKARTLKNLNLERTVRLVSWTDRVVPCGYLRIGRQTPLKVAVNRSGKLWF